ncbi:MAG: membrane protein insertion efficiency factor YidD [Thermoanaerobaculia bacterium]
MSASGPEGQQTASRQARVAVLLLAFYKRAVSPWLPRACRYEPTCSAYAREAIERHGLRRGARLALRRLLRCHPFRPGGFDPVP